MQANDFARRAGAYRKRLPVSIVAAAGVFLSLAAYRMVSDADEQLRHVEAQRRVTTHANVIQGIIDRRLQQLDFARVLFSDGPTVDPGEFNRFAHDVVNDFDGVRAVMWVPRIDDANRRLFEASLKAAGGSRSISEFGPDGSLVPSGSRGQYFPILQIEPRGTGEVMRGYDFYSNAINAETMRQAITTGELSITPAVELKGPHDRGAVGVLAFVPVTYMPSGVTQRRYPEEFLIGLVAAVYPIGPFIESTLKLLQPAGGLDIYVVGADEQGSERILYFHPSRAHVAQVAGLPMSALREGWFEETSIRFGNRNWNLIFRPVPTEFQLSEWRAAEALGFGLLLTALLTLYVLRGLTRRERVERLVGERTWELSQVNNQLEEKIVRLRTTEDALRDAEARQQDFAAAASDWFWEMDAQFRFTWASAHFSEKIALSEEEILGRKLWQVRGMSPAAPGSWRQLRDSLDAGWAFRDFDCTLRGPSNEAVTVRFGGRPYFDNKTDALLGYRGTATDITRQVLSQQEAVRAHRQLLSAMDSMPDHMALYDADDRLVYCNKRGREMCQAIDDVNQPGVAYETLLRAWLDRGLVPEAEGRGEEWIQERLASHRNPTGAIEVRRGDRVLEVRDHRVADGSIFQVAVDVTNIRFGEEQLRRAQKMEAVGTFAGGIAHDFNNILGVIRGYADLARAATSADAPIADHLTQIVRSVERASAVTKALLAFTRKRAPELQVVDMTRLLGEQTFLLKPLLKSKIALTIQSEGAPGFARIDPDLFGQAIVNLAINARDAMPDGGQLQIAIDNPDEAPNLRLPDGSTGWIRVTVTDTGMGMDAKTCARIFEPFFTTKEQGKGTGLGLAMVYSIVTQAGGSITVASEPGWGTTFTIHLPAVMPPTDNAERLVFVADAGASPTRRTGQTILLADDEPELRTLLTQVLTTAGYRVLAAADGAAALELYDANTIDLLVTDIVMPELDGLKLSALCRELQPALPVIYITGDPGRGGHEAADIPRGAVVLFKPFHPQHLVEAAATAIAGQTVLVEEEVS